MENNHTWNSDNKCIQIHSPNNIFIFNKKKTVDSFSGDKAFLFFLAGNCKHGSLYMTITKEFSYNSQG